MRFQPNGGRRFGNVPPKITFGSFLRYFEEFTKVLQRGKRRIFFKVLRIAKNVFCGQFFVLGLSMFNCWTKIWRPAPQKSNFSSFQRSFGRPLQLFHWFRGVRDLSDYPMDFSVLSGWTCSSGPSDFHPLRLLIVPVWIKSEPELPMKTHSLVLRETSVHLWLI